jgi:hypothetical protein
MAFRKAVTLAAVLALCACPRSRRVVVIEEEHERHWLAGPVEGDQNANEAICQFTVFRSTQGCHVCGEREVSSDVAPVDDAGTSFGEVKTVPFESDLKCREEKSICRRDIKCECLDLSTLDPDVELLERLSGQSFCR